MHVASLLNSQAPSIAPKITNYRFFLICLLNCLLITLNPIFLIEFILYMSDHELVIHLILKKKKNPIVWNFFQSYMWTWEVGKSLLLPSPLIFLRNISGNISFSIV